MLAIASNAHELAARAADNARFDMQTALEEVATAEKIIRRCVGAVALPGEMREIRMSQKRACMYCQQDEAKIRRPETF